MKYNSSLKKKEREEIFRLFTENSSLRFNEIEKKLNLRSNMVSYHLEQMLIENILQKKQDKYSLTKEAEKYLPMISHVIGKELSPLPIVLVAVTDEKKVLLIKRKKRPYKDYWSMIGGKILLEETVRESALRVVREKTGLNVEIESINSVLHERVFGEEIVKHGFILILVKTKTKETKFKETRHGELKWFEIDDLDEDKIIPSDYYLLKHKLNKKIKYEEAIMREEDGDLSSFKILR